MELCLWKCLLNQFIETKYGKHIYFIYAESTNKVERHQSKEIKLSLCFIKHRAIKTHGDVGYRSMQS
jgi:hypothetical protein